jgi:hypothetical protein
MSCCLKGDNLTVKEDPNPNPRQQVRIVDHTFYRLLNGDVESSVELNFTKQFFSFMYLLCSSSLLLTFGRLVLICLLTSILLQIN